MKPEPLSWREVFIALYWADLVGNYWGGHAHWEWWTGAPFFIIYMFFVVAMPVAFVVWCVDTGLKVARRAKRPFSGRDWVLMAGPWLTVALIWQLAKLGWSF